MGNSVLSLWGKADKGEVVRRHPLLFHMLDTSCVTRALWENSLSRCVRRQMAVLSYRVPRCVACPAGCRPALRCAYIRPKDR